MSSYRNSQTTTVEQQPLHDSIGGGEFNGLCLLMRRGHLYLFIVHYHFRKHIITHFLVTMVFLNTESHLIMRYKCYLLNLKKFNCRCCKNSMHEKIGKLKNRTQADTCAKETGHCTNITQKNENIFIIIKMVDIINFHVLRINNKMKESVNMES